MKISTVDLAAKVGLFLVLALPVRGPAEELALHVVPTPIKSYRLLAMSMDDDGFIWAGAIHHAIHRYDPRTGQVETVELPYKAVACSCLCAGPKVYVLGQTYPRLIIYDRSTKKFDEKPYPSPKPDVWYGTELIGGRYLYLFDRGGASVIKWDTREDVGKVIAYPYKAPLPGGGYHEPRDGALWCRTWDAKDSPYVFHGLARLDLETDRFAGYFEFPRTDEGLKPSAGPDTTFFLPYTLKGKVVPFDFKEKRWCQFLDVPEFGKRFGFMGGPWPHKGKYYFSLSTYNGTERGCDGKPFHFCNAVLEFDPAAKKFAFLTLEAKDAYYQIAYMLSARGDFFATGTNIREPDGSFNRDRTGEVVFWQTTKAAKPR
jgi:hypothetical protein